MFGIFTKFILRILAITLLMVMAIESPISAALAECTTIINQEVVESGTKEVCGFKASYSSERRDRVLGYASPIHRFSKDEITPPTSVSVGGRERDTQWISETQNITSEVPGLEYTVKINRLDRVDYSGQWIQVPPPPLPANPDFHLIENNTIELPILQITTEAELKNAVYNVELAKLVYLSNLNPNEYNYEEYLCPSVGTEINQVETEICTTNKPGCSGELKACKGLNWDCRTDCIDLTTEGQCITNKADPWTIDYSWGTGGSWFCEEGNDDIDIDPPIPPIEPEEEIPPVEPIESRPACMEEDDSAWKSYLQEYENYKEDYERYRERSQQNHENCYAPARDTCIEEVRAANPDGIGWAVLSCPRKARESCPAPSEPTRPSRPSSSGGGADCEGGETTETECDICEAMRVCKESINNLRKSMEYWFEITNQSIYGLNQTVESQMQQNRDYLSWILIRIGQTNDLLGIIRDALFEILSFEKRLNNIEWYQGQLAVKTNQLITSIQEVKAALENLAIEFPEIVFPEPQEDFEYDYTQPLNSLGEALEAIEGQLLAVKEEIDTSLAEVIDEVGGDLKLINTELVTIGTGLVDIRNEIDTSLAAVETWLSNILLAIEGIKLGVVDDEGTEINIGKLFEINLEKLGDINATLEVSFDNLLTKLAGIVDLITSLLDLLLPDRVVGGLENIYDRLADVIDAIEKIQMAVNVDLSTIDFREILTAIRLVEEVTRNLEGMLEDVQSAIVAKLNDVILAIQNIKITVGDISTGDVIVDFSPIVNLLSSVNGKIDGIQDTLHNIWLILHGGRGDGLIIKLDQIKAALENISVDAVVDIDFTPVLNSIESNTREIISSIESLKTGIEFPEYPEFPEINIPTIDLSQIENTIIEIRDKPRVSLEKIENTLSEIRDKNIIVDVPPITIPPIDIDLTQLEDTTTSIESWAEKIHIELTKKPEIPELEDCVELPTWYEPGLSLPPLATNREYCPYEPEDNPDDGGEQCVDKPPNWNGEAPPIGSEWCEDEPVDICIEKPPDYQVGDLPPDGSEWCEDESQPGLKVCPTNIWNDDPFPVHLMAQLSTKFPIDIVGEMPAPVSDDNLVIEFFGVEENVSWFVDGVEILKYPVWLSFVVWVLVSL